MKTSAAVLIFDEAGRLFVVNATGSDHWGPPKGLIDPGESPIDAAVRELYEETNIRLEPDDLIDLGVHRYIARKDLHFFLVKKESISSVTQVDYICHSMVPHRVPFPEVNGHHFSSAWRELCTEQIVRSIHSAMENINE